VNQSWTSIAIPSALWFVMLTLQLADLGTARFDSRRLARGAHTVVRLHPVAWVIPFAALVIIGIGFGLDYSARLFTDGSPLGAIVVGTLLVVALVTAWLIVTVATTQPSADSYRAIRDELFELAGSRVRQDWLDALRARLLDIDRDSERSKPPVATTWASAARWVVVRPQRTVPVLFALASLVVVGVAAAHDPGYSWIVLLAIGAVLLSAVLSVTGARASLTLVAGVRAAQVGYRAEVEHLLVEAERTARKPVAGLGDRVARALQILREQQG